MTNDKKTECEKCHAFIVVAPNLKGETVTFHEIPSMREGYYTYIESECK